MPVIKGQAAAIKILGVNRETMIRKIQPVMLELHEMIKNPGTPKKGRPAGKNGDVFYDPIALDRWKAFLAQLDRRGGRAKALDYRSLYLAWLEGYNK